MEESQEVCSTSHSYNSSSSYSSSHSFNDLLHDEDELLQNMLSKLSFYKNKCSCLEEDLKISKKEIASLKTSNDDLRNSLDDVSKEKLLKENNSLNNEVEVSLKSTSTNLWHIGSGCSRHMIGDMSLFIDVKDYKGGKVTFENDVKAKVIGIESIGKDGKSFIDDVFLVDGMKYNLLSVSQLYDKRNKVTFSSNGCLFGSFMDDKVIFKGERSGNTYTIDLHKVINQSFKCLVSISDESWLWNRRLGHASMKLPHKLAKEELVNGLPKDNLGKFDAKTIIGIFLGYSTSSKAYRVFNKHTLVVEESVNVVFNESNKLDLGKGVCVNDLVGAFEELKVNVDDPSKKVDEPIEEAQEDQYN
eukprot:XP_015573185.1 uncharacterized protein LOC107261057 [Ricinus communis]